MVMLSKSHSGLQSLHLYNERLGYRSQGPHTEGQLGYGSHKARGPCIPTGSQWDFCEAPSWDFHISLETLWDCSNSVTLLRTPTVARKRPRTCTKNVHHTQQSPPMCTKLFSGAQSPSRGHELLPCVHWGLLVYTKSSLCSGSLSHAHSIFSMCPN